MSGFRKVLSSIRRSWGGLWYFTVCSNPSSVCENPRKGQDFASRSALSDLSTHLQTWRCLEDVSKSISYPAS